MGNVRNLLPHTDRRPDDYRVNVDLSGYRDHELEPCFQGEFHDYIETSMQIVKLALICAAGILMGALAVIAFWG